MIEETTNDALMQQYRFKITRLIYECEDQRKNKCIAIGVAVAITVGWALCLVPVRYLQNEYNALSDKANIMAQTIESYSSQIDAYDVEIEQLRAKIPQ